MNDCTTCDVETDCHYPFKPCDCFHYRKLWSPERRALYDKENCSEKNKSAFDMNCNDQQNR